MTPCARVDPAWDLLLLEAALPRCLRIADDELLPDDEAVDDELPCRALLLTGSRGREDAEPLHAERGNDRERDGDETILHVFPPTNGPSLILPQVHRAPSTPRGRRSMQRWGPSPSPPPPGPEAGSGRG